VPFEPAGALVFNGPRCRGLERHAATPTDDAVQIRPVTFADSEAVLALWRVVFPEYGDPFHPQRRPGRLDGRSGVDRLKCTRGDQP